VYERCEPLSWWKQHKAQLPHLWEVARWLLCISASSAEVERLFSKCSIVLGPRRNRLSADKEDSFLSIAYDMARKWKHASELTEAEIVRGVFGLDD